jgi:outer membrane protein, heavy metal efflux system
MAGMAIRPAAGRRAFWLMLGLLLVPASSWAQAPTLEMTGIPMGGTLAPGSNQSRLGPMPGAATTNLGVQPGKDELILGGRTGSSTPRVPATITTPGQGQQVRQPQGMAAPPPLRVPRAPLYGTLALPVGKEEEGPPDGLSLDQAIDLLIRNNLDLKALSMEIPQARADILTASLRANPILYSDAQLVPYGTYTPQRPGGQTQYDLNISHPIDYSHKRWARMDYAERALRVTEAQYQNAVRMEINNLYIAFVDVLAARQTVRYTKASVAGLDVLLQKTQLLYDKDIASRADVNEVKAQRQIAEVGVLDAEENLRKAKRTLAMMLNLAPEQADSLEVRGTIEDRAPPPPSQDELIQIALSCRPDVVSFRLGLQTAESGVRLARANRFQDAYVLYQPYTFQNNMPTHKLGATSWALGVTFPMPLYNRNQGNIERARQNVIQSQLELKAIERRVITEVQQAIREYDVTGQIVRRTYNQILPTSKTSVDDRLKLFQGGETNVVPFLQAQKTHNDNVKAYLDTAARHRRSMLSLNTALGQRVLP